MSVRPQRQGSGDAETMKITGYGEDGLTYWVLQHQLGALLRAVGDDSHPVDCSVYFRPSFGRRGNPPVAPGSDARSSQFGEFDAIIGSPRCIYLIETKWKPSSRAYGGTVALRSAQVLRHKVFRAYLTEWRSQPHGTWSEFSLAIGGVLPVESARVPVAPVGSQLARNLERVLSDLAPRGVEIRDILLFMQTNKGLPVSSIKTPGFTLVTIRCPSDHGFIELA